MVNPSRQLDLIHRYSSGETAGDVDAAAECCPVHYCRLDKLQIGCAHAPRAWILQADPGGTPLAAVPRLEVLATATIADEIHIHSSGQCGYGRGNLAEDALNPELPVRNSHEYCPSVVLRGPGVDIVRPGEIRVKLHAPAISCPGKDLTSFLQAALLPDRRRQAYKVSTWGCQGEPGGVLAEILVHNSQQWQADFSLAYRSGKKSSPDAPRSPGRWDWKGRLDASLGDCHWRKSFGGKVQQKNRDDEQGLFPGLRRILENHLPLLLDLADEYENVRLQWPDIRFSGGLSRKEMTDGPGVQDDWEIKLSVAPLLGADLEVDIFDFLVRSSHPYGIILGRIKDRLEKGIGNDRAGIKASIKLLLCIGGSVDGDLHWQGPAQRNPRRDGLIEASLRFGGAASVDVKGSVFMVRMAGQASLRSGAADSARRLSAVSGYCAAGLDGDKPVISGGLRFNGLSIYYTLFLQVGIDEIRDRPPANGSTANLALRLSDAPQYRHQSADRLFTLLEPWQWPDRDDAAVPVGEYMQS